MGLFTIDRTINFEEGKVKKVLNIIYSSNDDNEIENKMLEQQIVNLRENTEQHGFFRRRWTTFLKDFCLYNYPNITELGKLYMNDSLTTKEVTLLVLVKRTVNINDELIRPLELILNVSKALSDNNLDFEITQKEFENALSHYKTNNYYEVNNIISVISKMRTDSSFEGELSTEPCHFDIWRNLLRTAGISSSNNNIKVDCNQPIVRYIMNYYNDVPAANHNNYDFNDDFIRYIEFPTLIDPNGEVTFERTGYREFYPSIIYNYLFNMSINRIEKEILNQNQHGTVPFRILNGFNISTNTSDTVRNKELYSCFKGYENIIVNKLRNTSNKTYRFIADNISTFLLAKYVDDEDLSIIERFRKFYINNIDEIKSREKVAPKELKEEFLNKYPIEVFKTMKLEEYSLGLGDPNTFCREVEHGTYKTYGVSCNMDPNGSGHWGIYYSKDEETGEQYYKDLNNKRIDNPHEYWEKFRTDLYEFLINLANENPKFSDSYPMLKDMSKTLAKLCFMYYPNKFMNFVTKGTLQDIFKVFELEYDASTTADQLSYELNSYIRENVPEAKDEMSEYISGVLWAFKESQIKEETVESTNNNVKLTDGFNKIYYGAPGCGKSHLVKEKYCKDDDKYERITFHQEYTNGDFVGQIRPIVENDIIKYDFVEGPLTRILKKAFTPGNEGNMYYLIIEELNRGNAPAIFGDVFQLLDRDKLTGNSEYPIDNDDMSKAIYGEKGKKIYIPGNVSIIATMNSSDQNVFVLDTAFKRRWEWVKISNKFSDKEDEYTTKLAEMLIPGTYMSWQDFIDTINNEILDEKYGSNGEDKQLGIYFVDDKILSLEFTDDSEKKKQFAEKIFMYLWEDVVKYGRGDMFTNPSTLDALVDDYIRDGLKVFNKGIFPSSEEAKDE